MAGGAWTVQNKVRPGVYINIKSQGKPQGAAGTRGTVTMPVVLGWGPEKTPVEVDFETNFEKVLGYPITDSALILLREALKRVNKVILYRVNAGGVKAAATIGGINFTAKYTGTRGNQIAGSVKQNIDDTTKFDVSTYLNGKEVDRQTVAAISELKFNDYVDFSGSGSIAAAAGTSLTNGANGTAVAADYADYFTAIEPLNFNTMALPVDDAEIKAVTVAFIKRMREQEGKKVQAVLANYPAADSEGILSVKNGVILSSGTVIDKVKATAWVAGAVAGAEVSQSLTYSAYDDAVDVDTRFTNSQIETALRSGELVFVENQGRAIVEQEINTFVSFTPEKGKEFSKNRVVRLFDSIENDIRDIFASFYIGKVSNNDDGRNLFKSELINYLNRLQAIGAIQNLDPQEDIKVLPGTDIDSVVVNLHIQPVDAIEKIYITVTVGGEQ